MPVHVYLDSLATGWAAADTKNDYGWLGLSQTGFHFLPHFFLRRGLAKSAKLSFFSPVGPWSMDQQILIWIR